MGTNGGVSYNIDITQIKSLNDMLLIELGAENYRYAADLTRKILANGKFSKEQKIIYVGLSPGG